MDANQPEKTFRREMTLWTLTIAFLAFSYFLASGHGVFDDPMGKPIERRIYPFLFLVLIPLFVFAQAALSSSSRDGLVRMGVFIFVLAVGFWEQWRQTATLGLGYAVLFGGCRWVLAKTGWRFRRLHLLFDRLSENTGWMKKTWITIPGAALIIALVMNPVLTALFSSIDLALTELISRDGSSPDPVRLYDFPPSLIRRAVFLSWLGFFIFTMISAVGLFVLKRDNGVKNLLSKDP
jgi:hypothetical protein